MAVIKVDRAKVERVFQQGKAMKIVEPITIMGNQSFQRFTVWCNEPHGKSEGDFVSVTGELTHKPSSYEMNGETIHTSEASINRPQVGSVEPQVEYVEKPLDILDNAPF